HVGSWAGGDMDGNPDVHAKSIREALARQQQVIINRYFEECQSIAQRLSQSASRVPAASELTKRVEQYMRLLPGARAITPARHDRVPYRVFLAQLGERLRSTYEGRASGYESARQFRDDVALIAASLRANKGANAGLFYVERREVKSEGVDPAQQTLDVEQAGVRALVGSEARGDQRHGVAELPRTLVTARPAFVGAAQALAELRQEHAVGHAVMPRRGDGARPGQQPRVLLDPLGQLAGRRHAAGALRQALRDALALLEIAVDD